MNPVDTLLAWIGALSFGAAGYIMMLGASASKTVSAFTALGFFCLFMGAYYYQRSRSNGV